VETENCNYQLPMTNDQLLAQRDKYLASLKLGKQSPEYKRTAKAVNEFIKFLEELS